MTPISRISYLRIIHAPQPWILTEGEPSFFSAGRHVIDVGPVMDGNFNAILRPSIMLGLRLVCEHYHALVFGTDGLDYTVHEDFTFLLPVHLYSVSYFEVVTSTLRYSWGTCTKTTHLWDILCEEHGHKWDINVRHEFERSWGSCKETTRLWDI